MWSVILGRGGSVCSQCVRWAVPRPIGPTYSFRARGLSSRPRPRTVRLELEPGTIRRTCRARGRMGKPSVWATCSRNSATRCWRAIVRLRA
eukprot:7853152-Lingulodinium_polyedra.AAC.1